MNEQETELKKVWVFNGENSSLPSAIFTERSLAEEWIEKYKLSGILTAYPLNISAYDWAVEKGYFKPKREEHFSPRFIGRSTGGHEHYHYDNEEKE